MKRMAANITHFVDAIVLMGPPGSGKSHLACRLHERGIAQFEELEVELMQRFGTGAEFAAHKAEALDYIEARLREQLESNSPGQAAVRPVAIQSTGLSDRAILLRFAAEYCLLYARLNTPRAVCVERVQSRAQDLNLNNNPDYAARFHDYWHAEVAPQWSFDVELSGLDAEADLALLEAALAA